MSLRAQLSDAAFLGVESPEVQGSGNSVNSFTRPNADSSEASLLCHAAERERACVGSIRLWTKAIFSREGTSDLVLSHSIGKSGDSAKVSYHPSFTPSSSPQFFYLGPFSTRPIRFSPDEFLLRSSQRMFATFWVDDHRGERGGGDNVLQKKFSESFDSYWPVKSC